MSVRRAPPLANENASANAQQLRAEIETMRTAQAIADQFSPELVGESADAALHFDSLTETEKSAATIGAGAGDWKPIGFMNAAHYSTLLKQNALGGRLTQQIEVCRLCPVAVAFAYSDALFRCAGVQGRGFVRRGRVAARSRATMGRRCEQNVCTCCGPCRLFA